MSDLCLRCSVELIVDVAESVWGFEVPALFCPNCEAVYPILPEHLGGV